MNDKAIDTTKRFTKICFEITNLCNKNCNYCVRLYKKGKKIEHMTLEDYKYVVSCISKEDKMNFRCVVLTGGEPALNPHFFKLVKLIRKDFPKAELNIQSNGKILKKLPQRGLRILPHIKNVKISVSMYPGWNDEVVKRYQGIKFPLIYKKVLRKITKNNKIIKFLFLDYRIPFMKRIRRFLKHPKIGNVYFKCFTGFWNPYDNPNLSEEEAKNVRNVCCYYIHILGRKLYNCCNSATYEKYYNLDSVGIIFDKNWKKNFFKLHTWKACVYCQLGSNRFKYIKMESDLGYKKYKLINLETRQKKTRIKNHK
ncbi:hypothetical protein LCGC14_1219860 [marine sediment metagenome]|uniref:Radical SAM core domain-containing protein n=1 Tax=marine sediment metagenome TaxID=412755 RepID=A0A0F9LFL5_9ZZZZ